MCVPDKKIQGGIIFLNKLEILFSNLFHTFATLAGTPTIMHFF